LRKLSYEELLETRAKPKDLKTKRRAPYSLILDNIRSIYNVGSIFRSSDACLVAEIALCGFSPTPPRDEISKTALGAELTVPWFYEKETTVAIEKMKSKGYKVFALELTENARDINSISTLDFPLCFVLGNELSGVSDDALKLCDGAFKIQMLGVKHSFNVAVATGIALYEAMSKYQD